ncbi:MAG: hypothetical protein IPG79_11055 [Saprospiraceae bacterium]|nr:hypothetical protein [Saprospiraceae bacterium]
MVTNTGNVTLSNVEVNDPLFGLTFGPITPGSQQQSNLYPHVYRYPNGLGHRKCVQCSQCYFRRHQWQSNK